MDVINTLPEEMLLQIFSFYIESQGYKRFLRNIPLVCKKWNDLHSKPVLWIDVNSGNQRLTFKQLENLGERGYLAHARCLKLKDYTLHESSIIKLIRYHRNLTEVELRYCCLSRVALEILAENCSNIKSLDISISDPMIPRRRTMNFLLSRVKNLKRLSLWIQPRLDYDDLVSTLAIYCHSLEELKLMSDQNILPLDELVVGCPKLRILHVQDYTVVSPKSLSHNGFEYMKSFNFSDVDFGGIDLYSILRSSKDLESLSIKDFENVILRNIPRIPSEKMKCLNICERRSSYGCSMFVEEAVRKWKRSLTTLRLVGMRELLNEVLKAYLNQNPNPKLEILDLNYSRPVEEHFFMEFIKAAKNLQYLNISLPGGCTFNLNFDSIQQILHDLPNST